ncbi:MAG: hypothetical protein QM715_20070 [Nibricoccus sp.]
MKCYILMCLFAAFLMPVKADMPSLEKRVAALEQEVANLKEENRKLKESAVNFLSAELAKKETEHARFVYRTQILPMVKSLVADFGSTPPVFPKEEEIVTLADAYRPYAELMTSLAKTIGSDK